ncbi:response regulator [Pantoea sp. GM01]|uniref:response regulator n=1 Tax=Pantoea sp. GM01 TaxID=1144320 RepID=UPI00027125CF|nr:response regulator [Pantoea sp. GM01]EJL85164.1 response regulator containing a CheY-like receiver domain and an HTH DNA-binding domain [Pantoea sp. GM01]
MTNVMIVDDHPVARIAIRMLLQEEGHSVIGECADGLDALNMARQLNPDIMIIDIDIPSLSGIEVITRLRKGDFAGGILVMSGKDDEHYIKHCASAGADGFVSKRNDLSEVNNAIRALEGGYGFFPLSRSRREAASPASSNEQIMLASLSSKELQVLNYLARGLKIIDIAPHMKISNKTVSTYKARVMQKLELGSMVELYEFCRRNNIG